MKKIMFIVSIVVIAFVLASCGDLLSLIPGTTPSPATIQETLESFVEKLNSEDRSTIYLDLHPDAESADQTTSGYWDTLFSQDDQPFSIPYVAPTDGTETGTKVMETTITYVVQGLTETTDNVTITFKQDADSNWLIYSFYREGTELFKKINL